MPQFTNPPPAPNRGDRATFSGRVDAFLRWLVSFVAQLNVFASNLNARDAGGAATFTYTFDSSTVDSDPGSGRLRFDSATQNAALSIRIDNATDANIDVSAFITSIQNVTSNTKGSVRLEKAKTPGVWVLFDITSITDKGGYKNLSVVSRASSSANPFAAGDPLVVYFDRNGDRGDGGNTPTSQEIRDAVGILPITSGGSGANTSSQALVNLGAVSALSLNANTGSSLVGFLLNATSALKRSVLEKLRDQVSVKDFGAVGDGTTDDTAAFQAAINYAGSARTVFIPVGAYIISSSLTMRNGMKLLGEGDPTGVNGSAIKVNQANYTSQSFKLFVKPDGLFESAIFEGIRFLGGGNHFYFDLSSGSAHKVKWDNCVFQDSVGNHIYGANSSNGNGILVCRHRGCSVVNSGGIYSSGPINGTEISGGSWESMRTSCLYVADTGNFPNLKFTFWDNRIESLYAGISRDAFPVIQLDGKTFGANVSDNYHENTFTKLLKVSNSRGIVYARNTHTSSDQILASLDITDSQVSIYDNYSLVGAIATFTGTKNSVARWNSNQGFSISTLYGKTNSAVVEDPVFLGSGGISLSGYPNLYKGETNKLKIIPVLTTGGLYSDLLTVTSGSQAVLGSRAVIAIRATLLVSAIDSTVGANMMLSQELLITIWSNANGSMASSISTIGSTSSAGGATVNVRQKAGATTTSLTIEAAITNANLSYINGSKFVLHYSYIADENSSSGLAIN